MTEEDRMKRFVKHKIKVLKELGVSLTTEDEKRLATASSYIAVDNMARTRVLDWGVKFDTRAL